MHNFRIGTLDDYIADNYYSLEEEKWFGYTPVDNDKCSKCELIPICGGGCPREVVHSGADNVCENLKFTIGKLLDLHYSYRKREGGY